MKIGWLRFNQAVELDYWTSTSTGLEERISIIEALLNRGHRVKMFTRMKKNSGGEIGKRKSFKYSPYRYKKCDILFVESGTTNMNFKNSETGEPWIRDAMKIMGQHEGLVIWYYTDPLIPFPFLQLGHAKYPWGHSKNGYCGGSRGIGWTVRSGWGTKRELYGGKKHVVFVRSKKFDLIRKYANGTRYGYKELVRYFPFVYYPIAINQKLREGMRVRKKSLRYKLTYCGGDRGRRPQFREFYSLLGDSDVWGGWPKDAIDIFPMVRFHGKVRYFWQVDRIINRSLCTIQIAPTKMAQMGWVTHRPFETICDRSVALSEALVIQNAPKPFIAKKFLVRSSDDVREKLEWLSSMTLAERKIINEEQMHRIRNCKYDRVAKLIEKTVERRG